MGHGADRMEGVGGVVMGRREGAGGWTVPGRHHLPIALINITPLASRRDRFLLVEGDDRAPGVLTGKEPGPTVDTGAVSRPRMQSAGVRRMEKRGGGGVQALSSQRGSTPSVRRFLRHGGRRRRSSDGGGPASRPVGAVNSKGSAAAPSFQPRGASSTALCGTEATGTISLIPDLSFFFLSDKTGHRSVPPVYLHTHRYIIK